MPQIQAHSAPPAAMLSYWECLWNKLFTSGWSLSHYACLDDDTGAMRHLVRARRSGDELVCSAPTMTQAVQLIYAESKTIV